VLGKYNVAYLVCAGCGLVQAEQPYWLEEAYGHAISRLDTGIVQRNLWLAPRSALILATLFSPSARFLDLGGGTGLFVRLMRDRGLDFYWADPYAENVLAQGFEDPGHRPYAALTAFEVMEHVTDPLAFLRGAFGQYGARTMLFSQVLYGDAIPGRDWWYYGFDHGQHVSFYNRRTLCALGGALGMNVYSSGMLHILTDRGLNQRWLDIRVSRVAPLLARWRHRRRRSLVAQDYNRAVRAAAASGDS
jgi:hypothetical protein